MAITVNSIAKGHGQTQAPKRIIVVNADLDNSYPNTPGPGGYDIDTNLKADDTPTIVHSPIQPISNGTTIRYARLVNQAGVLKLRVFVDATLVEVANGVDLSSYTGIEVYAFTE